MSGKLRLWLGLTLLCLLLAGGVMSAGADEGYPTEAVTLPPEYADLESCIPPDLSEILPEGLFSQNTEEALAAAEKMSDWQFLLDAILSAVGLRLGDALGLLCRLVGLILIAAVCGRVRDCLNGGGGELFGFCLRLALYTAIVLQTAGMVEAVQAFFTQLTTLMGGMIPVMGVFYALGGNLGQAAAGFNFDALHAQHEDFILQVQGLQLVHQALQTLAGYGDHDDLRIQGTIQICAQLHAFGQFQQIVSAFCQEALHVSGGGASVEGHIMPGLIQIPGDQRPPAAAADNGYFHG
jgi:hypothetical protein